MNTAFNSFFHNFSFYLNENFSRPAAPAREEIRNGPLRIRRLDSLARLIIREDTENCAAVGLVNNRWLVTANNPEKIEANVAEILKSIKLIYVENGRMRTKKARAALMAYVNASASYVPNVDKLKRDVRKFLSSLKTNTIFKKEEISKLFKNGFKPVKNPKGWHAEIVLTVGLLQLFKNENFKVELGISKLCCRLCASGIYALQKTHRNLDVQVRGRHGNFYFAWTPSRTFFINDVTCFKLFVGKEAFQVYSAASPREQKEIKNALENLYANREALKLYFTPQRGAVTWYSDSPAGPDTESPQQPETESEEVFYSKSDGTDSED